MNPYGPAIAAASWALVLGALCYLVAVVFLILWAEGWKPGKWGAAIAAAIGGLLLGIFAIVGRRRPEDDAKPPSDARKNVEPLRDVAHQIHREPALGELQGVDAALEPPAELDGRTPEEKLADIARRRRRP